MGVNLTGTIGILKKAVRKRLVSLKDGDRLIEVMKVHTKHFRLPIEEVFLFDDEAG